MIHAPRPSFVCRFVPIAPDLDDDIDLTQQQPLVDPAGPAVDSAPTGNAPGS